MRRSSLIATTAVFLSFTAPALADKIDGDWCSTDDARNLNIDGPAIRTPPGAETIGEYGRHTFQYDGVEGTAEAGHTIFMQQFGDDDMRLRRTVNGQTLPDEQWRRCKPVA